MEYLEVYLTRKDIRRLFAKIEVDPVTHCWNWIGALNTYGYGEFWINGGMEQAHRLVYAWACGPIPKGVGPKIRNLDHLVCDNPKCCNPAHMILTLPRDNNVRGNSISAVNLKKTHCKRGHLLPTFINRKDGKGRQCEICRKITTAAWRQENRDKWLECKRQSERKRREKNLKNIHS